MPDWQKLLLGVGIPMLVVLVIAAVSWLLFSQASQALVVFVTFVIGMPAGLITEPFVLRRLYPRNGRWRL